MKYKFSSNFMYSSLTFCVQFSLSSGWGHVYMQLNEKAVFLPFLTSNMKKNVTVTCVLFHLHLHDQR